jgi:hypothetical protein
MALGGVVFVSHLGSGLVSEKKIVELYTGWPDFSLQMRSLSMHRTTISLHQFFIQR